jgi:hypothetical protein
LALLVVAALVAVGTALQPKIQLARERAIQEIGARLFAPYEAFYDLTHEVRVAARCPEPATIRSLIPKAQELEREASQFKSDWNYGNAVHYSNLALGRAALVDGKLEDAGRYLIRAGQTPGSPQLDDYGPDMTLALELLNRGQRQPVLEYIESCERFWFNRGKSPLKQWATTVREGGIPDFGSHAGKPLQGES